MKKNLVYIYKIIVFKTTDIMLMFTKMRSTNDILKQNYFLLRKNAQVLLYYIHLEKTFL